MGMKKFTQEMLDDLSKIGDKEFECIVPRSQINLDYDGWAYPSKKNLGEKPIVFDLIPSVNFVLSQKEI